MAQKAKNEPIISVFSSPEIRSDISSSEFIHHYCPVMRFLLRLVTVSRFFLRVDVNSRTWQQQVANRDHLSSWNSSLSWTHSKCSGVKTGNSPNVCLHSDSGSDLSDRLWTLWKPKCDTIFLLHLQIKAKQRFLLKVCRSERDSIVVSCQTQ